jgi:hypothetical protein
MSYEKLDARVLGRAGARIMTPEDVAKVTGGESNRPTSTISRDPLGRPRDTTQD